ncbi:cobaltochelatase subunit CobN, partial [Acinetobacter baumannii]
RPVLVLSTYPGKAHQMAHAVGLDALASAEAILAHLADAGYAVAPVADMASALLCEHLAWPVSEYAQALAALPEGLRADLAAAWGDPESDAAVV